MFLLVLFNSQAKIRLLGEADCAHTVSNQRRRGAAIVGFGTCCSKVGLICVLSPPNRELLEHVGRSGDPNPIIKIGSGFSQCSSIFPLP
jgi:hypothetical protein